uniref:Uncharacterized protein n=1 Tax=Triticum urartu TaxID=4572 RepID=A0A8R7VB52_TRIUA
MLVICVFDMETSALRSCFDIWIHTGRKTSISGFMPRLSTAFVQFLHVYLGASVIMNLSILWRCSPSLMVGA